MLVYMFRRNGDHALTTDMTGRNLPSRTPSRHWMYVETLDTNKFQPRRNIAEIIESPDDKRETARQNGDRAHHARTPARNRRRSRAQC